MGHSHDAAAHGQHHHGHAHGGGDKTRVLIAACLTGGFMVAEAVGGLLTGSLALLADAGHMLTDSVALVLAWYAFHLAAKEATARMTYGFDRFKTLIAYTNGLTVFLIGAWIVYEAMHRLNDPVPILGGPMLAIGMIGLGINIAAFLVLHGGDRQNLNMRGAILHVVGDLLGSVAAIAAAVIILMTGWTLADPILSVLVALLLFRSAWTLVRESGHLLLEGAPAALDRDAIARDIAVSIEGVRDVHHMHVWSLDGQRNLATLHVRLQDGVDAHRAIGAIKARLAASHGVEHATIEPEFGHCADAHHHEPGKAY